MKKVRTWKQVVEHPLVDDTVIEDNDMDRGYDYWIYLKKGYCNSEAGTHCYHEWGKGSVIDQFNWYTEPCDCEWCTE